MAHPLELQYDLTADELLTAIGRRFRLKVALEGAVAEVHFERKLKVAAQEGWLESYAHLDTDGMHDFDVITRNGLLLRVEVKTIRNSARPQVEVQKTRAAKSDPSSRYYRCDQFDVLAVNVGRHTGVWSEFRYILARELQPHGTYDGRLAVMHPVPLEIGETPWKMRFQDVIDAAS